MAINIGNLRDIFCKILKTEYGIEVLDVHEMTPGWSALAYRVNSQEKKYFLKVFEKK